MSNRFNGKQDSTGPLKGRRNKGVLKADRAAKRAEAELRNKNTDPRNTRAFRLGSSFDPTTGKRRMWKAADWKRHDEAVAAFVAKQREASA